MSTIKTIWKSVLLPGLGAVIMILMFFGVGSLILILSIPAMLFADIAALFKTPRDLLALLFKGFLDGVAQSIAHGGTGNKEKQ